MKTIFLSFFLLVLGCSSDDSDTETEQFSNCESISLRANIEQAVPAMVRSIEDGEPFYDGNRTYLEIDAESYIPSIAEEDQVTMIRIFAPSENLGAVNSNVMVQGSIYLCNTGAHGLLTNDFKPFYLIENLSLTN